MSAGPSDQESSRRAGSPEHAPGDLKRQLGTLDVASIQAGNILGSGIFVAPAAVALAAPGPAGTLLWLAGGLIAGCGAVVYAECGTRLPRSGGFYACYREAFGEAVAFVGGWAALLITYPASIAAIALIFEEYLDEVFPGITPAPGLAASAALLVVMAINMAGVRRAAWTTRVFTALKVSALGLVCVAALAFGANAGGKAAGEGDPGTAAAGYAALLGAMVMVLWTYDGWSDINMVAGEVRDPARTLGHAVLLGMGVLIAVYVAVQAAVGALLPPAEAASSESVLTDAVVRGLGAGSGRLVALLVVLATFGSVHGIILAASRLGYAMARDGVFFRWFGAVHPTLGTPARAVGFLGLASVVYVFVATFRNLLAFFSFTVWIFYALTAAGLLILRRRRIGDLTGWLLPGAAAAPWLLILTGLAMAFGLLVENAGRSLTGLAILLAGFPVHAAWRRFTARR